jgi:exosome complex component MTR3|eukprot:COSAG01_NODE_9558_length_2409_cov_958.101299_2_plen_191_part_00
MERAQYSERGRLRCDLRYSSCTSPDPERHRRTTEEKGPSQRLQRALEVCLRLDKYPKSVIDLYVFVLDSDGGVMELAITCGSLALAHAGIEMFDLVTACSIASLGGQLLADPTHEEEMRIERQSRLRNESGMSCAGAVMMATMPSLSRVTQVEQVGEFEVATLTDILHRCQEGCRQLQARMTAVLCADHT